MYPVLVTPPTELPISAEDAIARAPSLTGANTVVVTALIEAATSYLDGWSGILGRCLVEQTWKVVYRGGRGCIRIPFHDLLQVTELTVDGETIPEAEYEIWQDFLGWIVEPRDRSISSSCREISATFTAGYGAPDKVPAAIKHAIVLMAAGLYAASEANGGLRSFESQGAFTEQFNSPEMVASTRDRAVDMLLAPFRRIGV